MQPIENYFFRDLKEELDSEAVTKMTPVGELAKEDRFNPRAFILGIDRRTNHLTIMWDFAQVGVVCLEKQVALAGSDSITHNYISDCTGSARSSLGSDTDKIFGVIQSVLKRKGYDVRYDISHIDASLGCTHKE